MAPLTTLHIALNNLKRKPLRTIGLAVVVAVFSFTMFGGALLSESVKNGIGSMSQRLGADILVVPYGYDKKLQATLLRGEPSTFYLKGDLEDKLSRIPGIDRAASQLYLATLNAACCTVPVQLIAYDPGTDFVIQPWVSSAMAVVPEDSEIVVGDMIAGEVGDELSLFGQTFKIAARLDKTGMGFDTTVFMTMNNARKMLRHARNDAVTNYQPGSVSSIMVNVLPGQDMKEVANAILGNFAMDYNLDLVVSKNMISDIAKKLGGLSFLMHVLTGIFWLAAAGVLFLFFSLLLNERKREFGLFRILGATRGRLVRIILTEALVVSIVGGVLGVLAALALTLPFHRYISAALELPYLAVSPMVVLFLAVSSLVLAVVIGPLSSLYATIKIATTDIYLTLRRGE